MNNKQKNNPAKKRGYIVSLYEIILLDFSNDKTTVMATKTKRIAYSKIDFAVPCFLWYIVDPGVAFFGHFFKVGSGHNDRVFYSQ